MSENLLEKLKSLCMNKGYELLSLECHKDGRVYVIALKLDKFSEPKLEEVRDEIDYELLYNEWVKKQTRTLSVHKDLDQALQSAIDYLNK